MRGEFIYILNFVQMVLKSWGVGLIKRCLRKLEVRKSKICLVALAKTKISSYNVYIDL